jgi:hypothetical protein
MKILVDLKINKNEIFLLRLNVFCIIFTLEFVSKPIDNYNFEERQQVNVTGRIFHFQPAGVHAYIQVLLIILNLKLLGFSLK